MDNNSNSLNAQCKRFKCDTNLLDCHCKYCDFKTDLRITLNYHIQYYHKTGVLNFRKNYYKLKMYHCKKCSFTSYSSLVWYAHETRCRTPFTAVYLPHCSLPEDVKRYKCSHCFFRAKHEKNLKTHIAKLHAPSEWYYCNHCNYKTQAKNQFNEHTQTIHQIIFLYCKFCEYRSKGYYALQKHTMAYHTDPEGVVRHRCPHCSHTTFHRNNLTKHIITQHAIAEQIQWFQCDQCDFKAKLKHYLWKHIKAKHPPVNDVRLECAYCFFTTCHSYSMKKHILSLHTEPERINWFHCDKCDYKAKLESALSRHIKIKHDSTKLQLL